MGSENASTSALPNNNHNLDDSNFRELTVHTKWFFKWHGKLISGKSIDAHDSWITEYYFLFFIKYREVIR